jgi:intracellular septation protein
MADERPVPNGVRWAVDGGPGLSFIVVYAATRDFRISTLVLVIAAVAALAVSLGFERRFRPLPTFTSATAILFGGVSLLLRSPEILKMKMSIVDGLFGAVLFGGIAIGRNPLKLLLGASFRLSDRAWAVLAIRYGAFWWASALANEVVRRTQSEQAWVIFRAGALVAGLVFALAQAPFLLRHDALGRATEAPPPDLGV